MNRIHTQTKNEQEKKKTETTSEKILQPINFRCCFFLLLQNPEP